MDGYSNTPFSPGEDIPVELGSDLVPLTKKVHLTSEEYGIIVQRVFLPFMEALCGHNDRDYQNEVACGIAHSLLSGNGHILTILQARQCFEEGTVVVASDGNAYRIEESPNAFQTGENRQVYTISVVGDAEAIKGITEEHVVFTQRGEVEVRELVPGEDSLLHGTGYREVVSVTPTHVAERVWDREEPGLGYYFVNGYKVHNSGKSEVVARTVLTLGILLPKLVQIFAAEKIRRFDKGFRVGIYGPDYDKAAIIHGRIKDKAWSENAKAVYADPDIDIDPKEIKGLRFPNGFIVDLRTASAGARIEGHTYDLIVLDETQDVDDLIIDKSLRPMLATTHGSLIMLGTPAPRECAFKRQCYKNQEKDQDTGDWNKPYRRHYEFDWTYVAACLPAYMDHIKREAEDLGRDSDAFRMAYNLDWIDGRGRLFSSGDVHMNGITGSKMDRHPYESTQILFDYRGDMLSDSTGKPLTTRFLRPAAITTYDHTNSEQVFAIDYGKVNDSTVVTVGRVWWDAPEMVGDIPRYPIHINDWLVLDDMDYEQQYPRILDFLANYNVAYGINDATGVGDAVHERMAALLDKKGIALHPFKFSSESKSDLYKLFKQEWAAGRITYPAGQKAKMSRRTRFFIAQMTQLQKEFKGSTMVVRHPKGERYHDDFPDSCAMLVWAVNKIGRTPMAVNGANPIYDDFWSHQNRWLRNPAPGGKSTPRGKRR